MSYYYLLSTFPPLSLREDPPFDGFSLFSEVSDIILPEDRKEVSLIISNSPELSENPFIRKRREEETQLQNKLALIRGERRGRTVSIKGDEGVFSVYTEKAAVHAMNQKNPLKKELALDNYRWLLLDEAALEYAFEAEELFSFFLKLKLANRWSKIRNVHGKEVLNSILERNIKTRKGENG